MPFWDPCSPEVLHALKGLIKNEDEIPEARDDPHFVERTIKTLCKRMRKGATSTSEELMRVIQTEDRNSDCILVPTVLDGRPASSKGTQPHFLCCKLWRFSFLRSRSELKSQPQCRYPYERKMASLCINPFHYELVYQRMARNVPSITVPNVDYGRIKHVRKEQDERMPIVTVTGDELRAGFVVDYPTGDGGSQATSPASSTTSEDMPRLPPLCIEGEMPPSRYPLNSPLAELSLTDLDEVMDMGQASSSIVEFDEMPVWGTLIYHEEAKEVGPRFLARRPFLLIDGYAAPHTEDRWSLGYLSDATRPANIEETRKLIGPGARLYYIGGELFLECLSSQPLFVHSANCNQRHGWPPNTVVRVPPHCNLKVFNHAEFAHLVNETVSKGHEAVYALLSLANVRFSFVKGWGGNRYQRQDISKTHCWIECHLNSALEWVNRVMKTMNAPRLAHTSYT
ncbi:unnamed protein product, partial [Mesorhabditis spiculigera]